MNAVKLNFRVGDGRYEIIELIGKGGMGAVYRARDLTLDREVAIKIISPHVQTSPDYAQRFLQEGRALARITHPNVVTVYAAGQEGESPFLVMEFVPGDTLQKFVREDLQYGPADLFHIMGQLLAGLGAIHAKGIIHRDVKASNILITGAKEVKLLDLGVAKFDSPQELELTQAGALLGTCLNFAPEVFLSQAYSVRSDLFALGVVFYELLIGFNPFAGKTEREVGDKVIHQPTTFPADAAQIVPGRILSFVTRLLEKNPDHRFQSADDALTELKAAIAELPRLPWRWPDGLESSPTIPLVLQNMEAGSPYTYAEVCSHLFASGQLVPNATEIKPISEDEIRGAFEKAKAGSPKLEQTNISPSQSVTFTLPANVEPVTSVPGVKPVPAAAANSLPGAKPKGQTGPQFVDMDVELAEVPEEEVYRPGPTGIPKLPKLEVEGKPKPEKQQPKGPAVRPKGPVKPQEKKPESSVLQGVMKSLFRKR